MAKETLNVTIHNVETGEVIVQPMTSEEVAIIEQDRLETEAILAAKAAKEAATESAKAKLAALGLTPEEIAAL
jgi:hypothetical protein